MLIGEANTQIDPEIEAGSQRKTYNMSSVVCRTLFHATNKHEKMKGRKEPRAVGLNAHDESKAE